MPQSKDSIVLLQIIFNLVYNNKILQNATLKYYQKLGGTSSKYDWR